MVGMGLKPLFVCMAGVQHIWGQKFVDSRIFLIIACGIIATDGIIIISLSIRSDSKSNGRLLDVGLRSFQSVCTNNVCADIELPDHLLT